jgi:hypothetical protein
MMPKDRLRCIIRDIPWPSYFSERRLGEVGLSPCLPARGRAHKSPAGWRRSLACTRTENRHDLAWEKEGPSGRMGRTTVLLTPTIVSTRYQAHRPDGLSLYAKPSLLLANLGKITFHALA